MDYRIRGLDPVQFDGLFGLSDADLAHHLARRYIVDKKPGFPDRIALCDVELGETVLLLNFVHQPAANPYQANHAIFVREGSVQPFDGVNTIPDGDPNSGQFQCAPSTLPTR